MLLKPNWWAIVPWIAIAVLLFIVYQGGCGKIKLVDTTKSDSITRSKDSVFQIEVAREAAIKKKADSIAIREMFWHQKFDSAVKDINSKVSVIQIRTDSLQGLKKQFYEFQNNHEMQMEICTKAFFEFDSLTAELIAARGVIHSITNSADSTFAEKDSINQNLVLQNEALSLQIETLLSEIATLKAEVADLLKNEKKIERQARWDKVWARLTTVLMAAATIFAAVKK